MLASSDYCRLSHYLNPVVRGAPQSDQPQVSVLLVSQLMACYGKGGTTPPLESCFLVYELNTDTHNL